jgi:hypothetical protein
LATDGSSSSLGKIREEIFPSTALLRKRVDLPVKTRACSRSDQVAKAIGLHRFIEIVQVWNARGGATVLGVSSRGIAAGSRNVVASSRMTQSRLSGGRKRAPT